MLFRSEGGIRVPSIVSWPRGIPAGQTRNQMVCGIDWVPTVLDWTGSKPADGGIPFDGKSIAAVVQKNADSPHEYLYWLLGRGKNAQWAVRNARYKLLGNHRDVTRYSPLEVQDRKFLVDLEQDVGEKTNLSAKNEKLVKELSAIHERLSAGF